MTLISRSASGGTTLCGWQAAVGAGTVLTLAAAWGPVRADDLEAARQQFLTSCGTCHAVEKDAPPRQGPNLFGVFGRKSGTNPVFKYTDALTKAGLTWDEATLERWIEDASSLAPGTVMSYRQANPDKRRLVIQYVKSLSP